MSLAIRPYCMFVQGNPCQYPKMMGVPMGSIWPTTSLCLTCFRNWRFHKGQEMICSSSCPYYLAILFIMSLYKYIFYTSEYMWFFFCLGLKFSQIIFKSSITFMPANFMISCNIQFGKKYHTLSISSSIDGNLGYFQFLMLWTELQ